MREPRHSDAEIETLRAEVRADGRSPAFVPLARALNARGEHREALEVAQRGLLAHPDSAEGRLALAVAESALGRVREALEQIKRALLIDQDNAEALALMGRILLGRGLPHRAAQFLAHAVKLAPEEPGHRALLAQARSAAAADRSTPPRFGPENVPERESPWSDSEKTVFGGRQGSASPDLLDARLAALPVVRMDPTDEEPTRLADPLEVPERGDEAAGPVPPPVRRGKMGGSAAELSRVLPADEAEALRAQAEARMQGHRPPLDPAHFDEEPTTAVPPEMIKAAFGKGSEPAEAAAAPASSSGARSSLESSGPGPAVGAPGPVLRDQAASAGVQARSRLERGARLPASAQSDASTARPAGAEGATPGASGRTVGLARRPGPDQASANGAGPPLGGSVPASGSAAAARDRAVSSSGSSPASMPGGAASASVSAGAPAAPVDAGAGASPGAAGWVDPGGPGGPPPSKVGANPGEAGAIEGGRPGGPPPGAAPEKPNGAASARGAERASPVGVNDGAASATTGAPSASSTQGHGGPTQTPGSSAETPGPSAETPGWSTETPDPSAGSSGSPKSDEGGAAEASPIDVSRFAVPRPERRIGPVATRMVDDALFAILGQRRDEAEGSSEAPAADEAPAGRPRVVRTSAGLGRWAVRLGVLLLAAGAFWVGFAAAVAPGDAGPEMVVHELEGVAGELERGGLAALLAAEERILELRRMNPTLAPLLAGARAEVHARRYARFGHAPKEARAAWAALRDAAEGGAPTVETALARVLLSTSAPSLERLDRELSAALDVFPTSPKAWVGRALVQERLGRPERALAHLLEARALHPEHRQTLLETARWLARRGAAGSALEVYAELQRLYDVDVEAAIERFVLGWATGADPRQDEAVAILAGLVREEHEDVAKDEAGRAALAFALPRLRDARVQEGLTELARAEGAFGDAPRYQSAVGRVLLAAGEAARSVPRFERAVELEPRSTAHRIDLARARFLDETGSRFELDALRRRVARLQRDAPLGEVRLPHGVVRAVPTRFELVEVELDPGSFPERRWAEAVRLAETSSTTATGGPDPRALEAAFDAAVATAVAEHALERGDLDAVDEALGSARAAAPGFGAIRWLEGRLLIARGELREGAEAIASALETSGGDPRAWLDLARARARAQDDVGALEAYAAFFEAGGLSPDARIEEAALRARRRDDEGALAALEAARDIEPDNPAVAVLRAEVLLRQERTDEARKALARAVAIDRGVARGQPPAGIEKLSPAFLTELGARALGTDRRLALGLLRAALEEEGAPARVHFYLGKALVARRATRREGRRELERYLSLAPKGSHRAEAERLTRRRR